MRNEYPYPASDGIRSLVFGIIFSIITCGIYGLYWQYKQMKTLNAWLGRLDFSFWLWFFLSMMTCGIFGIYYEYKLAKGINEIQENHSFRVNNDLPVICLLLAIFGIGVGSLAVQQFEINKFYDETSDI